MGVSDCAAIAAAKRFSKRVLIFLRQYYQAIIAACSLIVAALSLWSTLDAQTVDRQYKEFTITPHLIFDGLDSELIWQIQNTGVGPAVIKRIIIESKNSCIDTKAIPERDWPDKASAALSEFVDEMLEGTEGLDLPFTTTTYYFVVGQFIAVGERRAIVQLGNGKEVSNHFAEINRNFTKTEANEWPSVPFYKKLTASNFPMDIQYCSVSGKTCSDELKPCKAK